MLLWVSALTLGLAGSLHCAGMCGPIAIALPRPAHATPLRLGTGRLLYNLGRTLTYAALGFLFGWLGLSVVLAGWQRGLSIGCGVALLLYLIARALGAQRLPVDSLLMRAIAPVQRAMARQLSGAAPRRLLLIGMLNGLLPCGLVYVALAGATAAGSPLNGMLFMALFGLGTSPMLFAMALAGPALHARMRGRLGALIPTGLLLLALLFIVRGLNLGIPYLSPQLADPAGKTAPHACCSGHGPSAHAD